MVRASAYRGRVALPALVGLAQGRTGWLLARHGALLLGLAGLPFFIMALADPRTAVTREEVSYPGRRISLMIDASSSMLTALPANRFAEGAPNNAAFFTTVGAARYFIERRMNGKYRDLMSLIEFGDDAYVITPFTTDYENILLSTSLIGDWQEFMSFPDQGTVIARAVEQSVAMFESFKYLDAAGNLMVLFSDGADAEVLESGKSAMDVVEDARRAKIPIYFIKVGRDIPGRVQIGDEMWRTAVERTGGHFYGGADEASIEKALSDIDRASAGRIEYKQVQHRAAAVHAVCAGGGGVVVAGAAAQADGAGVRGVSVEVDPGAGVRTRLYAVGSRSRGSGAESSDRSSEMRAVIGYLIVAAALAVAGAVLWSGSSLERRVGRGRARPGDPALPGGRRARGGAAAGLVVLPAGPGETVEDAKALSATSKYWDGDYSAVAADPEREAAGRQRGLPRPSAEGWQLAGGRRRARRRRQGLCGRPPRGSGQRRGRVQLRVRDAAARGDRGPPPGRRSRRIPARSSPSTAASARCRWTPMPRSSR